MKTATVIRVSSVRSFLVMLVLSLACLPTLAATKQWTGASTSGDWSAAANWDPAGAPANGDNLLFLSGVAAVNLLTTNDLVGLRLNSITFDGASGGFFLRGNGVTVNNGIFAMHAGGNNTIVFPLTVGAVQTFRVTSGVAGLILGNINLNGFTLTFDNAGPCEVTGVISGGGGVSKTGTGHLRFTGTSANSYPGDTLVIDGVLRLDKIAATAINGRLRIGNGAPGVNPIVRAFANAQIADGAAIVIDDGLLDLNGFSDTVGAISMFHGARIQTGTGTLTPGDITVDSVGSTSEIHGRLNLVGTRTFNMAGAAYSPFSPILSIHAEVIGSGGLTKTGWNPLELRGANSYTGVTTVEAGRLFISHVLALGSTGSGTVVAPGAGLVIGSGLSVGAEPLTLSLGAWNGPGTLWSGNGASAWAGNITLANDSAVRVVGPAGTLTLSGAVSGPGALMKEDDGTLILSGSSANSHGHTFVLEGTLRLEKTIANVASAFDRYLYIGDGGWTPAVVRMSGVEQLGNRNKVDIRSNGLLDLNGVAETLGSISGDGRIELGDGHLRPGNDAVSSTFSGVISGTGHITKIGTGTWTLSGDNTYTGPTFVEVGTLIVNGSQPQSRVVVQTLGTLSGSGTVGHIMALGAVAPGASPGILTCSNLAFSAGGDFIVEMNGLAPGTGHDQLNVRGTNNLADANLQVIVGPGFVPRESERFTILTNDLSEATTGTFAGLPNGSIISSGGLQFRILYNGGSGNDVQLVVTNTALRNWTILSPTSGNGNGTFDPNECNNLAVVAVTNVSGAPVTGISATLVPLTPGMAVTQPFSPYPDLPVGGKGTNLIPYQVSTMPGFVCGDIPRFDLILETASHGRFRFPINFGSSGSAATALRFNNNTAAPIPDLGMVDSTVAVSGIDTPIKLVVVSLHITHTAVEDLDILLESPTGITVLLSSDNGGLASDYGTGCADGQRTIFNSLGNSPLITSGAAPFVGTFRPEFSLFNYGNLSGSDANGTWTLRVIDDQGGAVGTLRCWSLFISPTVCADGGGACESCPERTIYGSLNDGSQTSARRLVSAGAPSYCGYEGTCPGIFATAGAYHYDSYSFVNYESNACITVSVTAPDCDLYSATYTNSFNPGNLCQRYLADMGSSTAEGGSSYSFQVGAGAQFEVVVNEMTPGAGCGYILTVSGGSCRPLLEIERAPNNRVVVDWTTAAAGYSLERRSSLTPPSAWVPVTTAPVIIDSRYRVTNNASGSANFYRLRQP